MHAEETSKIHVTPQKLQTICLAMEAMLMALISLAHWFPTTPKPLVLRCLGQGSEIYYDFSVSGGQSGKTQYCVIDNVIGKYACYVTLLVGVMTWSNILEIFFTVKILIYMRNQTKNIASMVSKEAFSKRNRDDGIVIAVTFWQWIAEITLQVILGVPRLFLQGENLILEQFYGFSLCMLQYTILPSFYLLADTRFRRSLDEKGFLKAIKSAITQNYQ